MKTGTAQVHGECGSAYMASAGARAYKEVEGQSPWSGAKPPEAENFFTFWHPMEWQNFPHFCVL